MSNEEFGAVPPSLTLDPLKEMQQAEAPAENAEQAVLEESALTEQQENAKHCGKYEGRVEIRKIVIVKAEAGRLSFGNLCNKENQQ